MLKRDLKLVGETLASLLCLYQEQGLETTFYAEGVKDGYCDAMELLGYLWDEDKKVFFKKEEGGGNSK